MKSYLNQRVVACLVSGLGVTGGGIAVVKHAYETLMTDPARSTDGYRPIQHLSNPTSPGACPELAVGTYCTRMG